MMQWEAEGGKDFPGERLEQWPQSCMKMIALLHVK